MERTKMSSYNRRKAKWGYIFLLPWLCMFCVFYLYPLVYGIFVSFTDFNLKGMNWIGLENYKNLVADYAFWRSLAAMFCYCLFVIPLRTFVPLWAANTIRPYKRGANTLVKLLIYLPSVACVSALVVAWKFMLAPGTGIVSQFMQLIGLGDVSLMDNAKTSIPVLSLLIAFSNMGSNLIVYSAALDGVPSTYYEAASLDGASARKQFWSITVPFLQPTIVYVLITSTIASLQIFVIPQMMTGGGPNFTSSALLMLVYNSAFISNKFGYASAIGVVLFVITAIVAYAQFKVTQREKIEY